MKDLHRVIIEPCITEKTSQFMMDEDAGSFKYAFKVAVSANKIDIRKAVEQRFGVDVDSVRTVIVPGKEKRVRYVAGRTPKWKKAYVKLKPGQSIAEFEGA